MVHNNKKQYYIFTYGSLMNKFSLFNTLGKNVKPIPCVLNKEGGYRRSFNFVNNITENDSHFNVVGIQHNKYYNTKVSGIIYKIFEDDLSKLDIRERNCRRIELE